MNSQESNTPFREPLEEGPSHKIKTLESTPDKLVRPFELLPEEDIHEAVERFRKRNDLLVELREKYNIAVPSADIVIGNNREGQRVIYTVTEKVYGSSLHELGSAELLALKDKIETLFFSILALYRDKYKHGGSFLTDISLRQFMYGRGRGEKEDRIYFVDIDPFFATFDKNNPESQENQRLFGNIAEVYYMINDFEDKTKSKLSNARQALYSLIRSIPNSEVRDNWLETFLSKLS